MGLTAAELKAVFAVDDAELERHLRALPSRFRAATQSIPDLAVDADVGAAEAKLSGLDSLVRGLADGAIEVLADTSQADGALNDLNSDAVAGGKKAGQDAGAGLAAGVITAIATIPVAGAIVGIGAAIGDALMSGLDNEVREDTLVAATGLAPEDAARIGRAAGEAYAGNFGESIEGNFDTARAALQSGLLDPDSTARDSQRVIEQLSGVAAILGEDIPRVARAAGVLLKTGMAADADQAFDIMVKGQQAGINVSEDLLDTLTEYPAVLQRLGLDAEDSLGLLGQGMRNGARDTDFIADALKEFQIRATDASETSARGYELIGLSAEGMTAKIAAGGEGAREGLQQVLDGLRQIEDPVKRNEAAVALFGTKAEDLGAALFALDLNTVATDLGKVEGAASGAITALGDNAAGELESARRDIEVAVDGISGAVAGAFGDDISDFATSVRTNRTAVVQFLLDMGNAGLDLGRSLVEAGAAGTESLGDFVGTTGPPVIGLISSIVEGLNRVGLVSDDARNDWRDLADTALESAESFDEDSARAADAMRTNLITNGIDPVQDRLNELGIEQVREAEFHDATVRLADGVAGIGYAADGTRLAIDLAGGSFDKTTASGAMLDEQIRAAVGSLEAQIVAGQNAGRTTEELTADYDANRQALVDQLVAMGLTEDEAYALADAYGAVPSRVRTDIVVGGVQASFEQIDELTSRLRTFDGQVYTAYTRVQNPDGSVTVDRGLSYRALGGPVDAGGAYIVGEQGPELFYPTESGQVIDASQTAQLLGTTPDRGTGQDGTLAPGTAGSGAGWGGHGRGDVVGLDGRSILAIADAVSRIQLRLDGQAIGQRAVTAATVTAAGQGR